MSTEYYLGIENKLYRGIADAIYKLLFDNDIDIDNYHITVFGNDVIISEEIGDEDGIESVRFSTLYARFSIKLYDPDCFDKILEWFKNQPPSKPIKQY